ncbi:MAG: UDP-glucose 4-epimerase GalE [Lewinellaceae bacterium]|nr:UDP-glucose 4-epimerase GalE [Saprospiraceae bacterium]MCB9329967.1 UDP-glucose 4-epimerase GalE [Lewinellaceae bacterium]
MTQNKTILVTGGAGFIGSHTVVALAEAGFRPVIIDDFSNSEQRVLAGLHQILGYEVPCYPKNCNDAATLRTIFQKENIQGVIHFAAFKAVGESMTEPLRYYHNNLGSLITLLEIQLEMGVPDLIFSSSCTVYGEPDTLPVDELAPVKPAISVYGNTKQIGEEILRDTVAAGKPLKIISLRYFNPIGAHPTGCIGELPLGVPGNLVPYITQTAAGLREQLTVFGDDYPTPDGTCIRDYIHVMDLAEAHVAALQALQNRAGQQHYDVFNVGTGQGVSVLDLVRSFEAILGQPLNYRIGPRRPGDVTAVYADATKIKQELGWTARRGLREALEDAWRWEQQLASK